MILCSLYRSAVRPSVVRLSFIRSPLTPISRDAVSLYLGLVKEFR